MIEIAEIDHALDLARYRVEKAPDVGEAGRQMLAEARSILEMLGEQIGSAGPVLWRATLDVESGHAIDWGALRDECLLASNFWIMRGIKRHTEEGKGRDKLNRDRKDKARDRRDEIRMVYRPGMSAEDVRRAIVRAGGENHKLRTIQGDLKKIRSGEN
jgi:hypothetical protein